MSIPVASLFSKNRYAKEDINALTCINLARVFFLIKYGRFVSCGSSPLPLHPPISSITFTTTSSKSSPSQSTVMSAYFS